MKRGLPGRGDGRRWRRRRWGRGWCGRGGRHGHDAVRADGGGQALQVWRKGPGDGEPLLLGEVTAKAAGYTGNPFGAAYVVVDAQYVYFADVGTVDVTEVVPEAAGDGVVYRVAR